jgi:hypothetical protein
MTQPKPRDEIVRALYDAMIEGSGAILMIDPKEYDKLQAERDDLRKALVNWLEFEDDSIKTHGEYCGTRINEAIKLAREVLEKWK